MEFISDDKNDNDKNDDGSMSILTTTAPPMDLELLLDLDQILMSNKIPVVN